jgi:hypothetical protein
MDPSLAPAVLHRLVGDVGHRPLRVGVPVADRAPCAATPAAELLEIPPEVGAEGIEPPTSSL